MNQLTLHDNQIDWMGPSVVDVFLRSSHSFTDVKRCIKVLLRAPPQTCALTSQYQDSAG